MMATASPTHRRRRHATATAWARYLEACRDAPADAYDRVEAHAWARLQLELDRAGATETERDIAAAGR